MGITYRALDTTLHRPVALKIVAPTNTAAGSAGRERFHREARIAGGLRHQNIATVYHFGVHDETGQFFYAMELVEGETLEERVRRTGPLDMPTAVAIAQQVVSALGAAEKNGLVHRDLKPGNLMLVTGDNAIPTVKIIDFGLAKALTAGVDPTAQTQGGFVGTPAFASPEQFARGPLDVRSDIYSLGATLWFALTGKTPFPGGNLEQIKSAQATNRLPLEQLRTARVPGRLSALLQAMLALEPAARPGTQALAQRLEVLDAPRRARSVALVAALVVFAIAAVTLLFLRASSLRHRTEHIGTANPAAQQAYLRGIFLWNKREYPEYADAENYFRQAIALDPSYARAYAGLSDVLEFMSTNPEIRPACFAQAEVAARTALTLDPALAEAHAALGLLAMNWLWDWPQAEREFRRAIECDPNYSTGHHWYGEFLSAQGRFDESLRELEQARRLDPALPVIQNDIGKTLVCARRFPEAEAQLREAITLSPELGDAHVWLAQTYALTGRPAEALGQVEEFMKTDHSFWGYGFAAYLCGLNGDRPAARRQLSETRQRQVPASDELPLVYACVGAGDYDQALTYLEHDCDSRGTAMTSLRVAPVYDPLRKDPRFAALLQRVHLAP
jgi:tetratricopeptide (TPR) repeat protein